MTAAPATSLPLGRALPRLVAVAAAVAFLYASLVCARIMHREQAYYAAHLAQKVRLQRLPAELTGDQRQIRAEQDRLRSVMEEIDPARKAAAP